MRKTLVLFLIVAMIGCKKKEDPKPAPEPEPPKTEATVKFEFKSIYSDLAVSIDWAGDAAFDTSFYKTKAGTYRVTHTVKQRTVKISFRSMNRMPGDSTPVNIRIVEGSSVRYNVSDTVFTNREFYLW